MWPRPNTDGDALVQVRDPNRDGVAERAAVVPSLRRTHQTDGPDAGPAALKRGKPYRQRVTEEVAAAIGVAATLAFYWWLMKTFGAMGG
jgi:ferric-dicitrate binding protein FerR (iron transport regulator)